MSISKRRKQTNGYSGAEFNDNTGTFIFIKMYILTVFYWKKLKMILHLTKDDLRQ